MQLNAQKNDTQLGAYTKCREFLSLSGRTGKAVASHAEGCKVARSNPGCSWAAPIYTINEALRGYFSSGWGVRPNYKDAETIRKAIQQL